MAVALIAATAACSAPRTGVLSVKAVNDQPSGAGDALARGDVLFSRGEYALALDAFRKAVRQDANDAHGLNGVAISYAAMGRHDLAREYFELALARAPQDGRISRNFARSLEAQGLRSEAQALLAAGGSAAGVPKATRPTLAQLAMEGVRQAAVRVAGLAQPELERMSLSEVRLRTGAPQLTARIVVADSAGGQARLAASGLTTAIQTVATSQVARARKSEKLPSVALDRLLACQGAAGADSSRVRLPATGLSIDLTSDKMRTSAASCAALAGGDARGAARMRKDARG
ncbi:tetratricopeptide repeat protein [Sphingobium bisphenolivorans]|uniref:tetratricopeptide repeat protein n=1 Tax=Sphingobium bisphenolivorans TaxID=1335760 RepID=UPI00039D5A69|nr:tetratricopeptide repeat protein [Sphingobium bisphenolivorans]